MTLQSGAACTKPGLGQSENSQEVVAALHHPIRRKIVKLGNEKGEVTVRELAKLLGHPLANVRYHVKVLAKAHILRPVGPRVVKGTRTQCWGVTAIVYETAWVRELIQLPSD